MANCCVVGCGNSYYRLQRWLQTECDVHSCKSRQYCGCDEPFQLLTFPKDESRKSVWIKNINRKEDHGRNWTPKSHSRICSIHFPDKKPSDRNPYPVLFMGYETKTNTPVSGRKIPAKRRILSDVTQQMNRPSSSTSTSRSSNISKVMKMEDEGGLNLKADIFVPCEPIIETVNVSKSISNGPIVNPDCLSADHSYSFKFKCDCSEDCDCDGCVKKQLDNQKLHNRITELESKLSNLKIRQARTFTVSSIKATDKNVRLFLGLPNKNVFNKLVQILTPKANRLRFWRGSTKVVSTKVSRPKPGPSRKLNAEQELTLTLLKLRMNLTLEFLANMFGISVCVCSQTIITWIMFLSKLLKPLIYHPSKKQVRDALPKCFKDQMPNIRGIIDCSEFFIEKPRSLEIQAATWSDYKQHNTVKALIDISPTGIIQFISETWGGRTSDRYIVLNSGYLDKIEPGDVILADRGFPIADDLLIRGARLHIPPGARGKEQMTRVKVHKTKQIANLRIHVERAINRIKWFRILSETLPISMVPLADDILTVCSALTNLHPPLVK